MDWLGRLALAIAVLALGAGTARAGADESPLSQLLQVQQLDRSLLAIDARGGSIEEPLELGERVLYTREQGRVGVAVTDRRMLAVASASGSWQAARYRNGEFPPRDASIADSVALFLTPQRALGFDGKTGNLVESSIGPRETVRDHAIGQNVVAVVTDRRALGLSANRGGFFDVRLRVGEKLVRVEAAANLVTLTTSQRLLIFRGPTASWEERRLPIN